VRRSSFALLALLATTACAGAVDDPEAERDELATAESPIRAGILDESSAGVVGILATDLGKVCTGVVISSRTVVTARHCIAPITPADGPIDCRTAAFGATTDAEKIFVTTGAGTAVPLQRHAVKKVLVPGTPAFCGGDLAILILGRALDPEVAPPMRLRLRKSAIPGEAFSAVGLGRAGEEPSGTRRRRDGLKVSCVGPACGTGQVAYDEWWGEGAVCEGDSGGPAVDDFGRVIGIASRKKDGCTGTIYVNVSESAGFLEQALDEAARTPEDEPGCAVGGSTTSRLATFTLLATAIFAIRRRASVTRR
jgi:hypothetical protein